MRFPGDSARPDQTRNATNHRIVLRSTLHQGRSGRVGQAGVAVRDGDVIRPLRTALIFLGLAIVAGAVWFVVFVGARRTWRDRRLLSALLAGCGIVVLAALLVVNEFVRSDGLWNR